MEEYVIKEDLIALIENKTEVVQDTETTLDIFLYKDIFNNPLNLSRPTDIYVSIWNSENKKLLQYNSIFNAGINVL